MSEWTPRVLPKAEWPRLVETGADIAKLAALMRKDDTRDDGDILVVEKDGQIVGAWALVRCVHVECVWIAPAEPARNVVGRHLLRLMRATARLMGVDWVYTGADANAVDAMLEALGAKLLPGRHYMVPVTGRSEE